MKLFFSPLLIGKIENHFAVMLFSQFSNNCKSTLQHCCFQTTVKSSVKRVKIIFLNIWNQECSELGLPVSRKSSSPSQQGLLANRERILEQLINTFDNALQDEFFEVPLNIFQDFFVGNSLKHGISGPWLTKTNLTNLT